MPRLPLFTRLVRQYAPSLRKSGNLYDLEVASSEHIKISVYIYSPLYGVFADEGHIDELGAGERLFDESKGSLQFFPCFDCVKSMCDTTPLTYEDSDSVTEGCWIYKADYIESDQKRVSWHPSIHMPKKAARIFLRVKDVRVERLQDITEAGKTAEGMHAGWQHYNFYELRESTIKPADRATYGFEANPWVWVNKFERISRKEAGCDA